MLGLLDNRNIYSINLVINTKCKRLSSHEEGSDHDGSGTHGEGGGSSSNAFLFSLLDGRCAGSILLGLCSRASYKQLGLILFAGSHLRVLGSASRLDSVRGVLSFASDSGGLN